MTELPYPPPPWRLHGRALIVPALVRAPAPPAGTSLLRAPGGRTLGGLLLATYGPRSTLAYHELLGIGGLIADGIIPAAWITHAHVDDCASIAGGRAIWGIPKHDGEFRWARTPAGEQVTVSLAGSEIVTVAVSTRPRAARLPVAARFAGRDGRRRAWAAGRLRATPVAVSVRVPPESPLSELSAVFARTAVAADVALRIGAPRTGRPARRGRQPAFGPLS